MGESFDPYLKWLGIPPKHQPPHVYRLLGIELFESDPDVIGNAADQRMGHLKNLATGKHAELSQRILNEISAARVRLLNPRQKAEYDAALRQQISRSQATPPKLPEGGPRPAAGRSGPVISIDTGDVDRTTAVRSRVSEHQRPAWLIPAAIGGGVCLVAVLLGAFIFGGPKDDDVRQDDQQPVAVLPSNKTVEGPASDSNSNKKEPDNPGPEPKQPIPADPTPTDPQPAENEPSHSEPTVEDPSPTAPDLKTLATLLADTEPSNPNAKPNGRKRRKPKPKVTPAVVKPAVTQKKLPQPDEKSQQAAEGEIRETFQQEFSAALTPESKTALAAELGRSASDSQETAAIRFVLLRMACNLAAEAEDLDRALGLADRLDQAFELDVYTLKAGVLDTVSKKAVQHAGSFALNRQIVSTARKLSEEAVAAGKMEGPQRLLKAALPSARKMQDPRLVAAIKGEIEKMQRLEGRLVRVEQAEAVLAKDPDDGAANLAAGSWHCFVMDDWDRGLPLLAKGSDKTLAELAGRELAKPSQSAPQSQLADGWWKLAEDGKGDQQKRAKARAVHWYKLALSKASGLARTKLEKRLQTLNIISKPRALRFDGQASCVAVRNLAYTGGSPVTIEAIVKPEKAGAAVPSRRIAGQGGQPPVRVSTYSYSMQTIISNDLSSGLALYLSSGYGFRFGYQRSTLSSSSVTVSSSSRVSYDKWTHVAGVYDMKEIRLYVDGKLQNTRPVLGPHKPGGYPFYIGATPREVYSTMSRPSPYYFRGLIRALRISDEARYLNDFEVPEMLEADRSAVLLFRFDEGRGTQLKNAAGKNGTGEIIAAQWVNVP